MRSKDRIILIEKRTDFGIMPSIINLGHRHLEKAKPLVVQPVHRDNIFTIPVDLLDLVYGKDPHGVESISFCYRK